MPADAGAAASPYDLVLRGTLVTPGGLVPGGWVAVRAGRVAALGDGTAPAAVDFRDAGQGFVMPGAIDGQTHAGSYAGLAGLASTTRSAVAGGVTTLVDMPYDNPDPVTTLARLEAKAEAVERLACCDVALYGTVARGQGPGAVAALAEAGIAALKISAFESHPVRFPRIPADETLDLLEVAAATGLPVGLHNENQEIVKARIARLAAAGHNTFEWHSPSRPPAAELAATAEFLELGAATGAHVHIVHISVPRGYELVARYRAEGFKATAELCLHYLVFDAAVDGPRLGARLKVNPPIRPGLKPALWAEFDRGRVEFVSSDHSSWPVGNKATPSIFEAGAGVPGLETLVPVFYTELARRRPEPIRDLVLYLCERPARFFGLWPRKGCLAVGADADLVLLEPADWTYDAAAAHDDLGWSPYDGMGLAVRVAASYVRGRCAFDGAVVTGRPGTGRYLRRSAGPA